MTNYILHGEGVGKVGWGWEWVSDWLLVWPWLWSCTVLLPSHVNLTLLLYPLPFYYFIHLFFDCRIFNYCRAAGFVCQEKRKKNKQTQVSVCLTVSSSCMSFVASITVGVCTSYFVNVWQSSVVGTSWASVCDLLVGKCMIVLHYAIAFQGEIIA